MFARKLIASDYHENELSLHFIEVRKFVSSLNIDMYRVDELLEVVELDLHIGTGQIHLN